MGRWVDGFVPRLERQTVLEFAALAEQAMRRYKADWAVLQSKHACVWDTKTYSLRLLLLFETQICKGFRGVLVFKNILF